MADLHAFGRYTTKFTLDEQTVASLQSAQHHHLFLVFDGVKMGATVAVNGHTLGQVTDQFLRYKYEVSAAQGVDLASTTAVNNVTVSFDSTIDVGGRFMACTGGWDWAPYTDTFNDDAHTFSKGIWKNVYLSTVASTAIDHVVPLVMYRGGYPTSALVDGKHAGFDVHVKVHLTAPDGAKGVLTATPSWTTEPVASNVTLAAGESTHELVIPADADDVKLWWPANTGGAQPLYSVVVSFQEHGNGDDDDDDVDDDDAEPTSASPAIVSTTRKIGFRYVALATFNDTDPAQVAAGKSKEGTEGFGMFFRVNGAAIFARGANMIPMEELEGR